MQLTEQIPNDPPQMGGGEVLLLAIIPVPPMKVKAGGWNCCNVRVLSDLTVVSIFSHVLLTLTRMLVMSLVAIRCDELTQYEAGIITTQQA